MNNWIWYGNAGHFSAAFALMDNWFSVLCEVPVATFWLLAAFYSWKFGV